jgi:hypothetical protein
LNFNVKIDFTPIKLIRTVKKICKDNDGIYDPKGFDIQEVINEFTSDTLRLTTPEFLLKWQMRRRYTKRMLYHFSTNLDKEKCNYRSLLNDLLKIIEGAWTDSFLKPMGIAAFNCIGDSFNHALWSMFSDKLDGYNGKNELLIYWKNYINRIRKFGEFANHTISNDWNVIETAMKFQFENTQLGLAYISFCCKRIADQNKTENYLNQLFTINGQSDNSKRGLLERLPINHKAPFLNSYCKRFSIRQLPSEQDTVLSNCMSVTIMGNHNSSRWFDPAINPNTRNVFKRWILRKDLILIFDEILRHRERKDYWMKWYSKIQDIRVWCPRSKWVNRRLGLAFTTASELSFPTLLMKIGDCMVFECGTRGDGAVYFFPTNGPIDWDMILNIPRDYKRHILDSPHDHPRNWTKINHFQGVWNTWQSDVDDFLLDNYDLRK